MVLCDSSGKLPVEPMENLLKGEQMGFEMTNTELKALSRLENYLNGFCDAMLYRCAIKLHIPDIILDVSQLELEDQNKGATLAQLARALPYKSVDHDRLYRMLRYMVHIGLLAKHPAEAKGEERYGLTRAFELMLGASRGGAERIRWRQGVAGQMMSEEFISTWLNTDAALYTSKSLFETKHGNSYWETIASQPELIAGFNDAMDCRTSLLMPAVVKILGHDDSGVLKRAQSVVDVGGGTGAAVAYIRAAFPHINCTAFDLPHVVAAAAEGLTDVELIGGSMFDHVPTADVVMLKSILHDWGDEDCLKILERCRKAISREGILVVVEVVLDEEDDDLFFKSKLMLDLSMMIITGGKERSGQEWNSLLNTAGFCIHRVTPALLGFSVIEAYPK